LNHNYFESRNKFRGQKNGTPMESPIGSVVFEIYSRELE
jgi:hypothetical protein